MTMRAVMMIWMGLGIVMESSIMVAGEGEGKTQLGCAEAGAGGIWVCRGREGVTVIWVIMMATSD
jgi:hypothetical protein